MKQYKTGQKINNNNSNYNIYKKPQPLAECKIGSNKTAVSMMCSPGIK
jgi:hypothetical protein